jgi:outer membrane biosynthesis protein TonB
MAYAQKYSREDQGEFKQAVMASVMLHILVVVISMIGLPMLKKPLPVITPINIEIVTIDAKTQTDRSPQRQSAPLTRPKPSQNTAEAPPDLTKEKPPDVKPVKQPQPVENVPVPKAEKIKKKPKAKPELTKKPEPTPKREKKNDFETLLKNLTPDETVSKPVEHITQEGENSPLAELGTALTVSELDAFRYQIEPCWNVPSGAKYAENLAVEIRVHMNRDATLRSAKVLDQRRYNSDTAFRAAADSALRALRNPRCSPLRLPPEKYETWKTIVINFDPRDML